MIKQAVYEMFMARQKGDLLMDAPATSSWRELYTFACDREYWRARVRGMRQPKVEVDIGQHKAPGVTIAFTIFVDVTWADSNDSARGHLRITIPHIRVSLAIRCHSFRQV